MAWQSDVGKHQHRKEASAAQRPHLNLSALTDAQDQDTKHKQVRGKQKRYGLKVYWVSIISERETWHISWYKTRQARAKGRAKAEKDMVVGRRPRFTRIEEIER